MANLFEVFKRLYKIILQGAFMETIRKFIGGVAVLGLFACSGDSAPSVGSGPGFPNGMTGKELFGLVSANLYVPAPLEGDDTYITGTANCFDGGKVRVETSKTEQNENSFITFTNCESKYGSNDIELKQNGTVNYYLIAKDVGELVQATFYFNQKLSYSGDIGFSADCEFTAMTDNEGQTLDAVEGSCTYTDSEGQQLSVNGEEMFEVVQGL